MMRLHNGNWLLKDIEAVINLIDQTLQVAA